jgi:predicted small metal-binding protein
LNAETSRTDVVPVLSLTGSKPVDTTFNVIADFLKSCQRAKRLIHLNLLDKLKSNELILIHMLILSCRDVGQNCDCIVQGETEEELMKNAAEHAVKDHGYTEEDIMTAEMKERIKSHIHKS